MPTERKKSEIHRAIKRKKIGAKGKATRENKGTTASLPLTGDFPSLKYGRPVKADSIVTASSK